MMPVAHPLDAEWRDRWARTSEAHASTVRFRRRVDEARRELATVAGLSPVVMWSAGKDSTVLVHLAREFGMPAIAQKDDLDYPGEREYIERMAAAWGVAVRIVEPAVSAAGWLDEHAPSMHSQSDLHSRSSGLSRAVFYDVVESAVRAGEHGVTVLGLRNEESRGRRMNFLSRGFGYTKRDGVRVLNPLSLWTGLDVLTYAHVNGIELLPVYGCIGLLEDHQREPWRIRKSWFVPGATSDRWALWMRYYWPELFRRWRRWFPDGSVWL